MKRQHFLLALAVSLLMQLLVFFPSNIVKADTGGGGKTRLPGVLTGYGTVVFVCDCSKDPKSNKNCECIINKT